MTTRAFLYHFTPNIPMEEIEASLLLAAMASEGLYGRSRMKLEARYRLEKTPRTCAIHAGTEVGQSLAKIFSAFLIQQFGEKSYTVEETDTGLAT